MSTQCGVTSVRHSKQGKKITIKYESGRGSEVNISVPSDHRRTSRTVDPSQNHLHQLSTASGPDLSCLRRISDLDLEEIRRKRTLMEERQELGGNAKETHGKETLNTEGRQRRTEGNVKKIEKNKWENRGKNKVI